MKHAESYHFIGIGGCGMSGLAAYLHFQGRHVTGSDSRESRFTDHLKQCGIAVFIGHDSSNVPCCDMVVVSSAIQEDNCELVYAHKNGIPVIRRGELLAESLANKKVIAVAGSHGKTSTAALLAWILKCAENNSSALIGGIMNNTDRNYLAGTGDWVVAEADESDGSMNFFEPEILLLLNIDDDHLDYYGSQDAMIAEYKKLAAKTRRNVILNAQDKLCRQLADALPDRCVYFGDKTSCRIDLSTLTVGNEGMSFSVECNDNRTLDIVFPIPDTFYLPNITAAISVVLDLNIPYETIKEAMATFKGVQRRAQRWGAVNGITIMEDYAHHPTEIKAVLGSITHWHKGRIICVFQPHRFTRSRRIAPLLAEAFRLADILILTEIYSADETPISGIDGRFVYGEVIKNRCKKTGFVPDIYKVNEFLADTVEPGDLVVFMGAGTVGSQACAFKDLLRRIIMTG